MLYGHTASSLPHCCRVSAQTAQRHTRSWVTTWKQPENTRPGGYGWTASSSVHCCRSCSCVESRTMTSSSSSTVSRWCCHISLQQVTTIMPATWAGMCDRWSTFPSVPRRTYWQARMSVGTRTAGPQCPQISSNKQEEGEGKRRLDEADQRKIAVELEKYIHPLKVQHPVVYNITVVGPWSILNWPTANSENNGIWPTHETCALLYCTS